MHGGRIVARTAARRAYEWHTGSATQILRHHTLMTLITNVAMFFDAPNAGLDATVQR